MSGRRFLEFETGVWGLSRNLVVEDRCFSGLAWGLDQVRLRALLGEARCFSILLGLERFALHDAERHLWGPEIRLGILKSLSCSLAAHLGRVPLQERQDVKVGLLKVDVLLFEIV